MGKVLIEEETLTDAVFRLFNIVSRELAVVLEDLKAGDVVRVDDVSYVLDDGYLIDRGYGDVISATDVYTLATEIMNRATVEIKNDNGEFVRI